MIIVGGGFAGAVAARELSRRGIRGLILEARERLGGRAWCKPNALGGLDLEMGGTWIDPRQPNSWREAGTYGIELGEPELGALPTTWRINDELRHGMLPVRANDLGDLEHLVRRIASDADRIDPKRPLFDQRVADLDIPLSVYLDGLGARRDTREAALIYLAAYGSAPPDQISALHLLRRIAAAGSVAEFVVSGASYPLIGGTTALLDAIVDEASVPINLCCPVESVSSASDGVRVRAGGRDYLAQAAVLTVPVNVWKHIRFDPPLSDPKLQLSQEELACQGTKLWMRVRGAPHPFSACGKGRGLEMLWSERLLDDGSVLMVGYGADAKALSAEDPAAVERALRMFLPSAVVTECCGHDWRHDRWSLETWAVFRPGQITTYEPQLRTREGRVITAGSATAIQWPGFIDGAIESGIRAADEAARLLNDVSVA